MFIVGDGRRGHGGLHSEACGLPSQIRDWGHRLSVSSPTELDSLRQPCPCHGSARSFSFRGVLSSMSFSTASNWLCLHWAGTSRFVRISSSSFFLISSAGNQYTAGRSQQVAILSLDFSGRRLDACLRCRSLACPHVTQCHPYRPT